MCGISGVYLSPGDAAAPGSEFALQRQLEKMADSIAFRGPDASGYWTRGRLGLAHRRLKIIDLSDAANQPMFLRGGESAGKLGVVFNGEIYNFRELRAELQGLGARFTTASDTEVILHAFAKWGEASFSRFNGIFAFALVDLRPETPRLWLVRDRFGVKPLFYASQSGRMAFASTLRPLLELDWVSRDLDSTAVFHFLKFSHVPGESSILRSVHQIAPGTALCFDGTHERSHRYWDPFSLSGAAKDDRLDEKSALLELEGILKRVVARQSYADVPVGMFLSGGIDSSLLTWALVESRGDPASVETFTIGYDEAEFDETPHAEAVAKQLGTKHRTLRVRSEDMIDLIPDIPTWFDQPFADPSLLSSLLLARYARQSVTVALGGDGGDELFFGYSYQKALLQIERLAAVPTSLRRAAFSHISQTVGHFSHRGQKLLEILQFENQAELFQYFVGTIGPMRMDHLRDLVTLPLETGRAPFQTVLDEIQPLKWEEKIQQVFVRTFLVDTVLAKTDRAGMAFGLEARVPFLDDELADFSSRIPFRMKYAQGSTKSLLRKLAAKKLSNRVALRPKQGFSIPLREWLRGPIGYLLDEYLNPVRLRREGVLHPEGVRELVRAHRSGKRNHSHLLWSLISLQMWKERYAA